MPSALIGHTGFVGGNLLRQRRFDDCYHSSNIDTISGRRYALVVVAAAPAEKWRANQAPADDLHNIRRLIGRLDEVEAARVVLISTVDVYPRPVGVNELSPIDAAEQHPYGKHRLMLEEFVRRRFPSSLVVRLPGLFGAGLKKNAIYDFLHQNEVSKIHCDSRYQFYGLDHLWADVCRMTGEGLKLVNVATEPVSIAEIAREAFGFEFTNRPPGAPARYDFTTRHDRLLGGHAGYLQDKRQVLAELKAFVERERAARAILAPSFGCPLPGPGTPEIAAAEAGWSSPAF